MSDRVFTEGFPERWSMVHRDDCTLLVRRGDMGMFITPSQAICMAPKLMQGEAWLGTAKEIAHAMAGSRERELSRIFDEFCDSCGIGPPHDEQDRPQSNIRSVSTWTCDRCDHDNDRPKHRENPAPAPISRGITPEHIEELRRSALMIRRWIPETFPEDENGQIHFARAVVESVASTIERALGIPDGGADTEAGEHQEVLDAIQSHNSGEEE